MRNNMAFAFFKKKDKKQKEQPKKQKVSAKDGSVTGGEKPKVEAEKKDVVPEVVEQTKEQKTVVMEGNLQIVRPHITEKATDLAAKNQYVFVVQTTANKKDIATSVEKMYGVNVKGVRIVNVHAKKIRLGKTKGVKKGYKKAMVQIREDQKIEILPT